MRSFHLPSLQRRRYLPMSLPTNNAVKFSSAKLLRLESPALLLRHVILFATLLLGCFFLFRSFDALRFLPEFSSSSSSSSAFPFAVSDNSPVVEEYTLEKVLKDASMDDNTVILTTLNEAWAAPNSTIDLFLESFRIGNGTLKLLNHLVIIAMDRTAFARCLELHKYCFSLVSEGFDFHQEAYFMTQDYLNMMWRRIDFLRSVLELGYNFVFTDADIMWFRDPFPYFYSRADFQIACDHFFGSSSNLHNRPNGGFTYVKANNRTKEFYKFWYSSRETYPGYHDQDVFNIIKFDPFVFNLGLKMRFLDTANFGGLCEPSKDLNQVCTMHANCCLGLENKLHDLRIMLEDWKVFVTLPPSWKKSPFVTWRVPEKCSIEALRHSGAPMSD
ncbi:hypothetical protein CsatB_027409 [Cannabis sativa]|uniref:Nucleotide-diphospho-sugar transferase domain-containing protein n=1 Tax=Cannabis sativa TaxID=3483 RepID=A0A7J6E0M1_CANSA|nr:hypothetical protein G4B88_030361 [Cannabis sativa]